MPFVPDCPEDIDPLWLTDALATCHPGVEVEAIEIADRAEVTNSHAWLRVSYAAGSASGPESLFCKLLPGDPARRGAIAQTQMGLREAKFYESLAAHVSLRVPKAHAVRYEEDEGGAFILLLEDLAESGCTISTGPESPSPDAAAKALEELATMHAYFEDGATRRQQAGWVPQPDPASEYGSMRLAEGLADHRDRLTAPFVEMAEVYIACKDRLHEIWREGPQTVIHGDTHIGNLFDDHGKIGFLDWGLVVVSTPLRDVSYFLNMCLSVEDRRSWERELIQHYLDVRRALKAEFVSFDSAWKAHRVQAAYLAPASCQIVTFPEDVTDRRKTFAAAFLERASAAIEDLESRAALKTFYDL